VTESIDEFERRTGAKARCDEIRAMVAELLR
jgi:hypothetical protein